VAPISAGPVSTSLALTVTHRVNFLSIWRLQTIIAHKAGWWPCHDPTWYGPISILLGVLEVNAASICASVPIFWPVIAPYLGYIFVTHEIRIEHEHRSMPDENKFHERTGSETELRPVESNPVNAHYNDSYIMGQVDPLRPPGEAPVQIRVNSDRVRDKDRKWSRIG
jgi:hypothetical protein